MRILILAHGDTPSAAIASRLRAHHELLIVTDGAAHRASGIGLTPDVLVGDLDSVRLDVIRGRYPAIRIMETPDQEKSDLEKAIEVARQLGAQYITIIGATGGRMDHTLANVAVLKSCQLPTCLMDDFGSVRWIMADSPQFSCLTFEASVGDTISLITFDPNTTVSISGVQWPLTQSNLLPGTRGVSNVAVSNAVTVHVHTGSLLACHLFSESVRKHSLLP